MDTLRLSKFIFSLTVVAFPLLGCGALTNCQESRSCAGTQRTTQHPDGGAGANGVQQAPVGETDSGTHSGTAGGSSTDAGIVVQSPADPGDAGTAMDAAADSGGSTPKVCGSTPIEGCKALTADAVFVSAGVAESGDGSQGAPVKTIAEGLVLAQSGEARRVVVCNGVYNEALLLEEADSGRWLEGGYNCGSWLYNPDGETLVRPVAPGFVLQISGTTQRVTISDVTFDAAFAMNAGESNVVAFIQEADDVQFKRVRLIAHDGMAGADGMTLPFSAGSEWPDSASLDGKSGLGLMFSDAIPVGDVGGLATTVMCAQTNESSTGGRGGDHPYNAGGTAVTGAAGLPLAKGGAGGISSSPSSVASGCDTTGANSRCTCVPVPGTDGHQGNDGGSGTGASSLGTITKLGWLPSAGAPGEMGRVGGGGGGGDGAWRNSGTSYYSGWVGGAGGGAGGCGGNGGAPGEAGGGSIALLIRYSQVSLESCELTAASGGDGGMGDDGQVGQLGGAGGLAAPVLPVMEASTNSYPCSGGAGGKGGTGGRGGSGAGGISAGVAWVGVVAPSVDEATTISVGQPGLGGAGIADETEGIGGSADPILEVPAME